MDKISKLPKELQLLILKNCNIKILGIIAQLSIFWGKISSDNYLWESLKQYEFTYRPILDNVNWKEYIREQHIIMITDTLGDLTTGTKKKRSSKNG